MPTCCCHTDWHHSDQEEKSQCSLHAAHLLRFSWNLQHCVEGKHEMVTFSETIAAHTQCGINKLRGWCSCLPTPWEVTAQRQWPWYDASRTFKEADIQSNPERKWGILDRIQNSIIACEWRRATSRACLRTSRGNVAYSHQLHAVRAVCAQPYNAHWYSPEGRSFFASRLQFLSCTRRFCTKGLRKGTRACGR